MPRHMIISWRQNNRGFLQMIRRWRRYGVNDAVPLLIGKLRVFVFSFQF